MHCHHCGFAVTAEFQFCPKCGNKLRRDCPTCGYVCSPEFRYYTAVASDRIVRSEKSPSPAPYFKRYGFSKDSPQAVFIVDKSGVIRYVYTCGTLGAIPSNAELLRQLATRQ